MNKETSYNIDLLRFIAAFTVVCFHFYSIFIDKFTSTTIHYYSLFFVSIFFIISGYVNYYSFLKHNNTFYFYKKRFFRIVPKYILAFLISVLILYIFSIPFPKETFFHLLFLQHLILEFPVINSNGSLWTLSYEFYLYLLFPFLFKFPFLNFILFPFFIFIGVFYNIFILLFYSLFMLGFYLKKMNFEINFLKPKFNFKIIRLLGYYSYDLYLFHFPLFIFIYLLF